ncbi:MAG: hypothetical protein HY420_04700 [Candidatus Kerfeldbacteria bacterium]|nr:hypothetical protein [Candidatus Kerfeldbacteria bacterium]
MTRTKRIRWHNFFSRGQHAVLANDLFFRSFKLFPRTLNLPRISYYRRDTSTYLDRSDYEKIMAAIRSQLTRYPRRVLACAQSGVVSLRSLERWTKRYRAVRWQGMSQRRVLSTCIRALDRITVTLIHTYWPIWVQWVGADMLEPAFKPAFGQDWHVRYVEATRPQHETSAQRIRALVLGLAIKRAHRRLTNTQLLKACRQIVARFGHLRMYFFGIKPKPEQVLAAEISALARQNPERRYREWQDDLSERRQQTRLTLNELDQKTRLLCEIMAAATFLREERIALWGQTFTNLYPLFVATGRSLGLRYEEFSQLTYQELVNRKFNRNELRKRIPGHRFIALDGVVTVTPINLSIAKATNRIKIIRGTPASPGRVRGRVQLADAYTFSKLKPGVIVVTGMTTPDAVPYLRRVKAIVTDEGGLTSHAAIIAREMHKPCIVGTKYATRVLKNGDRVEVDAKRGIVRKLPMPARSPASPTGSGNGAGRQKES